MKAKYTIWSGVVFFGIVRPRGTGKTILLKQMAASDPAAVHLSANTLPEDADLFGIMQGLAERFK